MPAPVFTPDNAAIVLIDHQDMTGRRSVAGGHRPEAALRTIHGHRDHPGTRSRRRAGARARPRATTAGDDAAAWGTFFAAALGATATLIGLLFVAVSINLGRVVAARALLARAGETLVGADHPAHGEPSQPCRRPGDIGLREGCAQVARPDR